VPAGFALYFPIYSTWQGPSLHLEDLFVLPEFRGRGIGKALLNHVAAAAVKRGCARLQWDVLDWNQPAIDFYRSIGATMLHEWRRMRVTGDALTVLSTTNEVSA
jgi:GNAT superfamily N-acetyltransferase